MRGRTVRENVIIAYRGANYELGQWPQGYGIWIAGTEQSQPNEWWPGTPEGWNAAWYRFVAIEVPGTISQVGQQAPTAGQPVAAAGQPGAEATDRSFAAPAGQLSAAPAQPQPGARRARERARRSGLHGS